MIEAARVQDEYNGIRLHAAIGYVTPTTNTTDEETSSAKPDATAPAEPTSPATQAQA